MKKLISKLILPLMLLWGGISMGAGYNGEIIAPNRRVSVDYQGADLVNVLRSLSFENDLNMIISDDVQGTVTLSVKSALIDDLLEAILRTNGYTYLQSGNLVEVLTLEKAKETVTTDKPISRTIVLKNVDAGQASEDVKKFLKPQDKIIVNPDNNSITVRARRREMLAVESFLRSRDGQSIEEVRKNVELIRTNHLTPKEAFEILGELGYKIEGDIRVSEKLNGLLVIADKEEVTQLKALINKIDTPDHQVVIEARIVEVSDRVGKNWGISWSYNKDNGQDNRGSGGSDSGSGGSSGGSGSSGGGSGSFSAIAGADGMIDASNLSNGISIGLGLLGTDQFTALYRNIVTDNSAEVLAKPTVTTLNNMKAKIDLVDEVPYKQLSYISDSGDGNSSSYEFKEVGITLEVTPKISEDGMIRMDVAPTISNVTGYTDDGVPFTSKRSVETNVIVRNGETLAIGGLIKDNSSVVDTKDPILSKIPIIGYFFRTNSRSKEKNNLMIFITPKLILKRDLEERLNLIKGSSRSGIKTIETEKTIVSEPSLEESKVSEPVIPDTADDIKTGIDRIRERLAENLN